MNNNNSTSLYEPDPVRFLRELHAHWPHQDDALRPYWKGMEMAVQVADRYYREYTMANLPPPPSSYTTEPAVKETERPMLVVIPESHSRTDPWLVGLPTKDEHERYLDMVSPSSADDSSDDDDGDDENKDLDEDDNNNSKHTTTPKLDPDTALRKLNMMGHLNLVHCITYGENHQRYVPSEESTMMVPSISSRVTGTPLFWKFLSVMVGEQDDLTLETWPTNFRHIIGSKTDPAIRVAAKQAILQKMKDRKLFLLDISPASVFLASGRTQVTNMTTGNRYNTPTHVLPAKTKKIMLQLSFEYYMKPMLRRLRPHNIMVIGKTIGKTLQKGTTKASSSSCSDTTYMTLDMSDFCKDIGAIYHEPLQHPSARESQGVKYLPDLLFFRDTVAGCMKRHGYDRTCPAQHLSLVPLPGDTAAATKVKTKRTASSSAPTASKRKASKKNDVKGPSSAVLTDPFTDITSKKSSSSNCQNNKKRRGGESTSDLLPEPYDQQLKEFTELHPALLPAEAVSMFMTSLYDETLPADFPEEKKLRKRYGRFKDNLLKRKKKKQQQNNTNKNTGEAPLLMPRQES